MSWVIYTNGADYGPRHFGTTFFDSKGNNITIKNIRVGDIISVEGVINTSFIEPSIKADVIRISY